MQKQVEELMDEPIIIYFLWAVNFSREVDEKIRRHLQIGLLKGL